MKYAIQTATEPPEILATFDDGATAGEAARVRNEQYRLAGSDTRVRVVRVEEGTSATVRYASGYLYPAVFQDRPGLHPYMSRRDVPVPADGVDWRGREAYVMPMHYLPWLNEAWWINSDHWAMHYPRPSKEDPTQMIHTPSEEWGKADRQLRMRPGKYLRRYFSDVLSEEEIQRWALAYDNEYAPRDLQLATTADDIEHVYANGPRSCMAGSVDNFASRIHPVRVYAAGDLAVAYITSGRDEIAGRAICWPAKQVYGRIYGDFERMEGALQRAGYREDPDALEGARLLKIEHTPNVYVMPYIDGFYGVTDCGDHFTIGGDDYEADRTDGLTSPGGPVCSHCEDHDPNEYGSAGPDGDHLCENCYNEMVRYCEDCGEDHWEDDTVYGPDDMIRCHACHDSTFLDCEDCGETITRESAYLGPDNRARCEDCHMDAVTVCDGCSAEVMVAECEGGKCEDCREEEEPEDGEDASCADSPDCDCQNCRDADAPAAWEPLDRVAPAPGYPPGHPVPCWCYACWTVRVRAGVTP